MDEHTLYRAPVSEQELAPDQAGYGPECSGGKGPPPEESGDAASGGREEPQAGLSSFDDAGMGGVTPWWLQPEFLSDPEPPAADGAAGVPELPPGACPEAEDQEDGFSPEPPEAFADTPDEDGSGLDEGAACRDAAGPRVLGIRLRKAGQVFFFPDEEHTVRIGSKVVVSLEQGPSLGEVVTIVRGKQFERTEDEESPAAHGRVLGLATAQDIAQHAENSILAAEASAFCKTCIRQRGLDMKLVDVEVLHDRSKIIFFFTAPSRIDFRELVKDLVRNYRTRIELRQIGVRHETQMIGGLGNCGMVCCCHKYLRKFAPVTIKMAKEQNLFLNPAKLSGMCGRLLCCLSFEQSNYEEFNRRCPKLGKKYNTKKGMAKVIRANMFSQNIAVLTDGGEELEMTLEEWDALEPRRAEPPGPDQQRAAAERENGRKSGQRREQGNRRDSDGPWQERGMEQAAAPLQDAGPEAPVPAGARQGGSGHNGLRPDRPDRQPGPGHRPRRKRRHDS